MITNYINTLLGLCLLLITTSSMQAIAPKQTKEKTIKASYQVKFKDLLDLDNRYGNISITNHVGSSVEVEVTVKAWDGTAKRAQETLDRISIEREQNGRKVTLKTHIQEDGGKDRIINTSRGFSINYRIKMPEQMHLELENKFGNVQLARVLGEVDLEVKHGNLETKMLGEGEVEVKFGNVSIEGFQKTASVKVKHGNLEIGQASQLQINQSHGNCQLGMVDHLEGEVKHGNTNIKQVAKVLKWENEFGNFNLKQMGDNFDKVRLEVKHGHASLDFGESSKFGLAARTEHGSIQHNIKNITVDKERFEHTAHGTVNGGGKASVDIAVEFGNINLY